MTVSEDSCLSMYGCCLKKALSSEASFSSNAKFSFIADIYLYLLLAGFKRDFIDSVVFLFKYSKYSSSAFIKFNFYYFLNILPELRLTEFPCV